MDNPMLVAVRTLLKETYDGPKENASWYTEAKPGSGLFGTLEKISAEDASIPINGNNRRTNRSYPLLFMGCEFLLKWGRTQ